MQEWMGATSAECCKRQEKMWATFNLSTEGGIEGTFAILLG